MGIYECDRCGSLKDDDLSGCYEGVCLKTEPVCDDCNMFERYECCFICSEEIGESEPSLIYLPDLDRSVCNTCVTKLIKDSDTPIKDL